MTAYDLFFLVLISAVAYLMVYAGVGKNALELRRPPRCPACGRVARDCCCR
jgi:hypothetical protein